MTKVQRKRGNFLGCMFFCYLIAFFYISWVIAPLGRRNDIYRSEVKGSRYYINTEKGKSVWEEITKTDYDALIQFDRIRVAMLLLAIVTFGATILYVEHLNQTDAR